MRKVGNVKTLTGIMFSLFIVFLVGTVYAIGQGDVTLITPTTNTWTNQSNYTATYNFTWEDLDDLTYLQANCSLYIGMETNQAQLVNNATNLHTSVIATNNTPTTLEMDDYFYTGNTSQQYQWTVVCFNETSNDGGGSWSPTPRTIYVDADSIPQFIKNTTSFTNATWITDTSPWWWVNMTDKGTSALGYSHVYTIHNESGYAFITQSADVEVNTNLSTTFVDGNYTLRLMVEDPALNSNTSLVTWNFWLDSTAPTLSWESTGGTDDGGNSGGNSHLDLNFTITERYLEGVNLTFDGTSYTDVIIGNCTETQTANWNCVYNLTNINEGADFSYHIFVNDTVGNTLTDTTRTFSVDKTAPTIITSYNFTVSASTASWNFTFNETNPYSCEAKVWDRTGSFVATKTGLLNITQQFCTGTFTQSDIASEGAFTIQYNLTDDVGTFVHANMTGVVKNIYSSEWNLISYVGGNITLIDLCDSVDGCTNVAKFDNSAKSYTTYSASTPTVNNNATLVAGDAFLMYTSQDDYVIDVDLLPVSGIAEVNITVVTGWNAIGVISNTTLNSTLFYKQNGTMFNVSWASFYDANADNFKTCSRSLAICAGTSDPISSIILRKGYAFWASTDNVTINRSMYSTGGLARW